MSSVEMLDKGKPERTKGIFTLYLRYVRIPQTSKVGWMPSVVGMCDSSLHNGEFYPYDQRSQAMAAGEAMLEEDHAQSERTIRALLIRQELFGLGQIGQRSPELLKVVAEAQQLGIGAAEITRLTGFTFEDTPPA